MGLKMSAEACNGVNPFVVCWITMLGLNLIPRKGGQDDSACWRSICADHEREWSFVADTIDVVVGELVVLLTVDTMFPPFMRKDVISNTDCTYAHVVKIRYKRSLLNYNNSLKPVEKTQ